jgi:hypothetical protein
MSGLDAAQRLQQRMGKNLPILIAASGDYKRLREGYGVFDYSLRKPIEVHRLARYLARAMVFPMDRTDRGRNARVRAQGHRGYCRSTRCWRAASARKRSMHSGFEFPRGAFAGSQCAPGPREHAGAVACVLCAAGRLGRPRSTSAPSDAPSDGDRAAQPAPLAARRPSIAAGRSTRPRGHPDSAPDACCASGLTQSATGAIADGVVGAVAGIGATAEVATTFDVAAVAASGSKPHRRKAATKVD